MDEPIRLPTASSLDVAAELKQHTNTQPGQAEPSLQRQQGQQQQQEQQLQQKQKQHSPSQLELVQLDHRLEQVQLDRRHAQATEEAELHDSRSTPPLPIVLEYRARGGVSNSGSNGSGCSSVNRPRPQPGSGSFGSGLSEAFFLANPDVLRWRVAVNVLAEEIYRKFLDPNSGSAVNLTAYHRNYVFEILMAKPQRVPMTLYNPAGRAIFQLMKTDSFARFKLQHSTALRSLNLMRAPGVEISSRFHPDDRCSFSTFSTSLSGPNSVLGAPNRYVLCVLSIDFQPSRNATTVIHR